MPGPEHLIAALENKFFLPVASPRVLTVERLEVDYFEDFLVHDRPQIPSE
jgi:hypothetical protein